MSKQVNPGQESLFDSPPKPAPVEHDFTVVTEHIAAAVEHGRRAEEAGERMAKQSMSEATAGVPKRAQYSGSRGTPSLGNSKTAPKDEMDETSREAHRIAAITGRHPDRHDWRTY